MQTSSMHLLSTASHTSWATQAPRHAGAHIFKQAIKRTPTSEFDDRNRDTFNSTQLHQGFPLSKWAAIGWRLTTAFWTAEAIYIRIHSAWLKMMIPESRKGIPKHYHHISLSIIHFYQFFAKSYCYNKVFNYPDIQPSQQFQMQPCWSVAIWFRKLIEYSQQRLCSQGDLPIFFLQDCHPNRPVTKWYYYIVTQKKMCMFIVDYSYIFGWMGSGRANCISWISSI